LAPPFVSCPAGAPLGALDLQVQPAGRGQQPLPLRTVNHLSEGDRLFYEPILRGNEKRPGEIALVLVPERRRALQRDILVTPPKPADKPQSWKIEQTISVAALVYGPSGLNQKKVSGFLAQDELLIAQLADYADKTAQAEQLVATLSNAESSSASVNAALSGFASQYGFALALNRSAPVQTQAATLFATMNPQLAAYNPAASSTGQRAGQTASLSTMVATLVLGSPVGLAAGATAMLLDLRAVAFPDTQFRASFAQPFTGSASGVNLCGQQGPLPPHTRAAYIWAVRIPNIAAPGIRIGSADFVPSSQKTALPVDVPEPGWKYLERVRNWTLAGNRLKAPVPVVKLGNQGALELDLTRIKLPPGEYKLTGLWDWTPVQADGTVHVLPLSGFEQAHLDPASQDRLVTKSGRIPVTLEGGDFEFTTSVELQKAHDEFAQPETLRFLLPKGARRGPQEYMDVQVDTQRLDPGVYNLLVSQQDGKAHPVNFRILPAPPEIDNLPIVANQGAVARQFVLRGERLELLRKLEAPGAILTLGPPAANQTERSVSVVLKSCPRPGTVLPVSAYIEDRNQPLTFSRGLQVAGQPPAVAGAKLSLPKGMTIALQPGEYPAGFTLNALLEVNNVETQSVLRLECAGGTELPAILHPGEQTAMSGLQQLSPGRWFLAFDTSGLPSGCSLQAVIDQGPEGASKPFPLARILRLPKIDSVTINDVPSQDGTHQYELVGQNLELIQKAGWNENAGLAVSEMPAPLSGPGLKQSLLIRLPDPPAPGSPFYIWLWGDQQGRETSIKAPVQGSAPPSRSIEDRSTGG
jgi:hypothetical protein